ncbi:hypothetical protein AOQ84DRAFT_165772 [Glonium stellatum]|uniref:Zinc finger PHD-type domain-containing protein n=1 Tax=Glonium stellatum TaxID=574774 RepID=A0A8E2JWB7_9PEZI|nr:hypothetical protein AOQ84DRAFT_165772 [Glonium stellatum]
MVNTQGSELKKFIGNACLYLNFDATRQRTFLTRNIKQVLDHHKRALDKSGPFTASNDIQADSSDQPAWKFPSKDMLEKLSKKKNAVLNVFVKGLKYIDEEISQSNSAVSPTRKRTVLLRTPCQVELWIWSPQEGDIIFRDSHEAKITVYRNAQGQKAYDIGVEPFRVEIAKLFVTIQKGHRWKKTIAPEYDANISIAFLNSEDAADLLSHLHPKKASLSNDRSMSRLTAKWSELPKCPPSGQLLPLTRKVDNKTKKLPFGIEVDMGWIRSKDSMLKSYNRALRATRANQLPSPVSETRPLDQILRVTYVFKDGPSTKTMYTDGALCPLCHRKDYGSLEMLRFHLIAVHDLFKFKMETKEKELETAMIISAHFECDLSDRYEDLRASHNVPDARDLSWVAPANNPFNLAKFVGGDDEWVAAGSSEKRKAAPPKTTITNIPIVKPKAPESIVQMPIARRKQHRVPRAPPGITFFRTLSKRALVENECVSESDDDVDLSWLKLRRNGATSDSDTPDPAKIFMKRFDDFIQDERLSGDIHAGDALVRFAYQNAEWVRQPSVAAEFMAKAAEFRSDRIITEAVYNYCDKFIQGKTTEIEEKEKEKDTQNGKKGVHSTPPQTPTSSISGSVNGAAKVTPGKKRKYVPGGPGGGGRYIEIDITESGRGKGKNHKTPLKKDDDGDTEMQDISSFSFSSRPTEKETKSESNVDWEATINDRCICGEKAESVDNVRRVIWCESPDCIRHCFHLACVGLQHRTTDWQCESCRSSQNE